jgi:hypothetical protein
MIKQVKESTMSLRHAFLQTSKGTLPYLFRLSSKAADAPFPDARYQPAPEFQSTLNA